LVFLPKVPSIILDLKTANFLSRHPIPNHYTHILTSYNMGYPETAEGFMVNDQKNWTKFEKKEVRG
jgi:hypothetical protein